MTNQEIVDLVENVLPGSKDLDPAVRERILDHVADVLADNRAEPEEEQL